MKKRVLATLLCLAMSLSLVACGSSAATTTDNVQTQESTPAEEAPAEEAEAPAEEAATEDAAEEEFHLDLGINMTNPTYMDPTLVGGRTDYFYMVHINEGLMKYSVGGDQIGTNPDMTEAVIQLGQAESYDFDEATLTYTFHLRDDIFWSDGEPVEAEDFVYAIQRLVNPETAAQSASLFNGIIKNATAVYNGEMAVEELGVSAPDAKTVVFELETDCAYFLELLGKMNTYPIRKDIVEADPEGWAKSAETVVTNGAYKVSEWNQDVSFTIVKNELYYDYENLGPDSITFHITNNATTLLASYQAGDWDYVTGTPADQRDALIASGDLFSAPTLSLYIMYMNTENTPDWRVRAAYLLAVDRDNIVDNIIKSGAATATGMIPTGMTTSDGATDWYDFAGEPLFAWLQEQYPDYDLSDYIGRCELAQALYAEAVADGYDTTKSPNFVFTSNDTNKLLAEAVQTDINNVLGCNLVLEPADAVDFEQDYTFARIGFFADFADPIAFFKCFGTNGIFEFAHYSNEQYDTLLEQAVSQSDGAERDKTMLELEKTMFSDQGFSIMPLYFGAYSYCVRDGVSNLLYMPIGGIVNFMYAENN